MSFLKESKIFLEHSILGKRLNEDFYSLDKIESEDIGDFFDLYDEIDRIRDDVRRELTYYKIVKPSLFKEYMVSAEKNRALQLYLMTYKKTDTIKIEENINILSFLSAENLKKYQKAHPDNSLSGSDDLGKTLLDHAIDDGDVEKIKYLREEGLVFEKISSFAYSQVSQKSLVEYLIDNKLIGHLKVDFGLLGIDDAKSQKIHQYCLENDLYNKMQIPQKMLYINNEKNGQEKFRNSYIELIRNGVSVEKKDISGKHPFLDLNHIDFQFLINKGLSCNTLVGDNNLLTYFLKKKLPQSDDGAFANENYKVIKTLIENGASFPEGYTKNKIKRLFDNIDLADEMNKVKNKIIALLVENKKIDLKNYNLVIDFSESENEDIDIYREDIVVPYNKINQFIKLFSQEVLNTETFNHVLLTCVSKMKKEDIQGLKATTLWQEDNQELTSIFSYAILSNNTEVMQECIKRKMGLRFSEKSKNVYSVYNIDNIDKNQNAEELTENGKLTWFEILSKESYEILKENDLLGINRFKYKFDTLKNYSEDYIELLIKDNQLTSSNINYLFESSKVPDIREDPIESLIEKLNIDISLLKDKDGNNLLCFAENASYANYLIKNGIEIQKDTNLYSETTQLAMIMAMPERIKKERDILNEIIDDNLIIKPKNNTVRL